MKKIESYEILESMHLDYMNSIKIRMPSIEDELAAENTICKRLITVCGGTGCQSSDSSLIIDKFNEEIQKAGIADQVSVAITGCFGFCEKGPIVKIHPDNVFYIHVAVSDVKEIVDTHLLTGQCVNRLLFEDPAQKAVVKRQDEISFYKKQKRVALRNCGLINPEDITDYIGVKGYLALGEIVTKLTPDDVIQTISASGLRGRGGGGFPTGKKWALTKASISDQKYIICNADEGDPGAFMDRSILEGDPNSVLEAMAIAGYAIGASKGYIYIRAEYPLAVNRIQTALKQAKELGLLGDSILGSNFSFDIELKFGAGAFVCGEETALIHSIEGKRGEPTNKPPFPAQSGLFGKPTCVNNVETLANIPAIILRGSDWYRSMGTAGSKGTKVFALAGKINNVGLVEVPMGTTLREIIYDIGGGIKNGRKFKAVQTGGPSGGCIPAANLDLPIDYESLTAIGSMMGSGGMIVMDEDNCMVDIAKFYLEFTVEESCGKCTPCRIGTKRLLELLTKITKGEGTEQDLATLQELGQIIKDTSLCGLGQTAPNPVLSTMQYFWDEYIAHVRDHRCPAGVCKDLIRFEITDKCIGCTKCARSCPVNCITGNLKGIHLIHQDKCIKCGACFSSCPVNAIKKI